MSLALLIFPCLALLCGPALWFVLGKPRSLPSSTDPISQAAREHTISIIIPARDEEHNISKLLTSIQNQEHSAAQVIVVNDASSDRTAEIALEHGAKVIDSQPLPDGWNGKPWACQQGADAATGTWFLFLDADTTLEGKALKSLHQLTTHPDKVYSVCPYHRVKHPYEQFSAFFNVMMIAGSNAFGSGDSTDPTLFGQCMLISREHYQKCGGHATVKDQVLENFHLSAQLKKLGIARQCFLGKGTVSMRMFPGGLAELWGSWQKGFAGGAANAAPRALFWSSIWISGLMFVLVCLGLLFTPYTTSTYAYLTAIAYLASVFQCFWAFRLAGSFCFLNALFFPISLIFYQTLFFSSLLHGKSGKQTQWKGRDVT